MNDSPKEFNVEAATRRITIAAVNRLYHILERIPGDTVHMALAETFDTWLLQQNKDVQTFFTGCMVCASCGHFREFIVCAADMNKLQCSLCGNVQEIAIVTGNSVLSR